MLEIYKDLREVFADIKEQSGVKKFSNSFLKDAFGISLKEYMGYIDGDRKDIFIPAAMVNAFSAFGYEIAILHEGKAIEHTFGYGVKMQYSRFRKDLRNVIARLSKANEPCTALVLSLEEKRRQMARSATIDLTAETVERMTELGYEVRIIVKKHEDDVYNAAYKRLMNGYKCCCGAIHGSKV